MSWILVHKLRITKKYSLSLIICCHSFYFITFILLTQLNFCLGLPSCWTERKCSLRPGHLPPWLGGCPRILGSGTEARKHWLRHPSSQPAAPRTSGSSHCCPSLPGSQESLCNCPTCFLCSSTLPSSQSPAWKLNKQLREMKPALVLAVRLANYATSLCLNFFIHKQGI